MRFINLIFLFIIFSNYINSQEGEFQIKITDIITKSASIGGYIFLETDGILIPTNSLNQENIFDLSIINEESNNIYSLLCFFYKFESFYVGNAKIACQIYSKKGIIPGKYRLYPLVEQKSFLFSEIYIVNILPYNFVESFDILNAEELYFYSLKKIDINFIDNEDIETIKFDLYDSYSKDIVFYLGDVPLACQCSGHRMTCPVSASDLPQEKRFQTLNVYIIDSLGNKKLNYFIYPINIRLYYIQKQNLKIKVSKLLTNCLTNYDFIVLDTSDDTLDNVLFSKKGFYLKVKKDDSINDIRELFCSFHKHPSESTKILCGIGDDLEDGFYSFEEYISEGPLEDEDDRISANYNVVIPTFILNGKFIYSSKYGNNERVYDSQLRDRIYLNYKNDGESLNFTLNHEYFEKTELFLGKNKIDCLAISDDDVACSVPSKNFEKSGIYYIEKISLLEERERLYLLPPVEVKFSWD